jgi:hypothetical protein
MKEDSNIRIVLVDDPRGALAAMFIVVVIGLVMLAIG